jgi:predicted nucleotidyltransferase component of viral defense system
VFHLTTVEAATFNLLQQIFLIPYVKNQFALAGGTALALQLGHRQSIDLDIFSPHPFNIDELENELKQVHNFNVEVTGKNSRMLFCYINAIKCDFVIEPATLLNSFIPLENSLLFNIEDIAAMKLHTICGRGKRKDFFDVYALLQIYKWEELLSFFERKYTASQLYFLFRSILYFEDAENDFDIIGHGSFKSNWAEIKKFIQQTCLSQ